MNCDPWCADLCRGHPDLRAKAGNAAKRLIAALKRTGGKNRNRGDFYRWGRAMFLSRLLARIKPWFHDSNYLHSPVRSPEMKEEQGFENSEGTSQRGSPRIICAQRDTSARCVAS